MMRKMIAGITLAAAMVASPTIAQEKCCGKDYPAEMHASHKAEAGANATSTTIALIAEKMKAGFDNDAVSEAKLEKRRAYEERHIALNTADIPAHRSDCDKRKAQPECDDCSDCPKCSSCDDKKQCSKAKCASVS